MWGRDLVLGKLHLQQLSNWNLAQQTQKILWDWCLFAVPRCSSHSNKWAERSARNTAICLKFKTKQKEWKTHRAVFILAALDIIKTLPPCMSCINPGEMRRSVVASRHFCLSSFSSVANPSTGVGRDRAVTGSVPAPSPAPTLTHCITAL